MLSEEENSTVGESMLAEEENSTVDEPTIKRENSEDTSKNIKIIIPGSSNLMKLIKFLCIFILLFKYPLRYVYSLTSYTVCYGIHGTNFKSLYRTLL